MKKVRRKKSQKKKKIRWMDEKIEGKTIDKKKKFNRREDRREKRIN